MGLICDLCQKPVDTVSGVTFCEQTIGVECGCTVSHPDRCCDDYACAKCAARRDLEGDDGR